MIPILIGTSILIFMIFNLAPGDFVSGGGGHRTAAMEAQIRHAKHLDEPEIIQYARWASQAIRGNLGDSFNYNKPVVTVINTYIWNSFILALSAFIVSLLIAIPMGVVSAVKQHSFTDSAFNLIALVGISVPTFFISLLFIKWFAVDLKLFPISGMTEAGSTTTGLARVVEVAYHMFLPFLVLTISQLAYTMKFVKASMLEVIKQDYIRTARAKGLKEKVVIYKHALRNAMIPVITLIGLSIPMLFTGAMITEKIFSWPGIGYITYTAVFVRDYPLLMGDTMLVAVLTLIGNLMADVSYALVDPRIRLK
jgi:peptide/nickel transport system permease protein